MNLLLYLLFLSIFSVDFISETFLAPRIITWLPEMISAAIGVALIAQFSRQRPVIPAKYLIWIAYMMLIILAGIVLNQVQPGAVFSGLRTYFRYAPVFILPLVYSFTDKQLKGQMYFLLSLAIFQLPVALYQRLVDYAANPTGDVVQGTVMGSGHLSVFLVCVIAILTAFYAKGRISLVRYAVLAAVCFIPTTINETTATLILLPIGIAAPFIFSAGAGLRIRRLLPVGVFGAVMISAFIVSYAAQFDRWGGDVTSAVTGRGMDFLYRGADETSRSGYGTSMAEIGRLDSILMPFHHVDDYSKIAIGVGIGNASATFNQILEGEFSEEVELLGIDFTTAATLIWEVGLLGLGLSLLLLYMIFRDALALRKQEGPVGAFSVGAAAVCIVLGATIFYTGLLAHNVVGYLMWWLFGHVVALRARQAELLRFDVERRLIST